MAYLFFPGQLTARSEFYHQLGNSLAAGLTLGRALRILAENPPAHGLSKPVDALATRVEAGDTLGEALRRSRRWAPDFDVALIDAGEQSGRLDQVCKLLATNYSDQARLARQVLLGMAYPVFVFHFAFLIVPIGHFIEFFKTGDVAVFLTRKALFFVPFYAAVVVLLFAGQSSHGRTWRSWVERVTGMIPGLGGARQSLMLARFALALDALQNAGVVATRAWPMAAAASGSPKLERRINHLVGRLEAGETPSEILLRCGLFPVHFTSVYASAEEAGRVDEALPRLSAHYQEEGLRRMKIAAGLLTGLVYGAVLLTVAYQIVSFWIGHYNRILDIE